MRRLSIFKHISRYLNVVFVYLIAKFYDTSQLYAFMESVAGDIEKKRF